VDSSSDDGASDSKAGFSGMSKKEDKRVRVPLKIEKVDLTIAPVKSKSSERSWDKMNNKGDLSDFDPDEQELMKSVFQPKQGKKPKR